VKVIGLTGSIGSGKSSVAHLLAECGARVIDADELARQARREKAVEICREFPEACPSGKPQSDLLAELVFSDEKALRRLEAVIHPYVRQRIAAEVARAHNAGPGLLVVEAPLLYETGWNPGYDGVLVVTAPDETRYRRVRQRSGLSRAEFYRRDRAQLPQHEKAAKANWVIFNGGGREELARKVRKWCEEVGFEAES